MGEVLKKMKKVNLRENYKELRDEELVKLSLENSDFFYYLVKRYKTKLANYIRRISNFPKETVEDILQEIFIKVYQNLAGFDKHLKFSSWIYRIAHNQTISSFRKFKSRGEDKIIVEDEKLLSIVDKSFDIRKEAHKKELIKAVRDTLEKVPLKYREVLILRLIEEKDYNEISDILKKPVNTISTLIRRGREYFKKYAEKNNLKKFI